MQKLGQDVIEFYEPFRNKTTKWKTTVVSKQKFQIDQRYELVDVIGEGAYGIVVAAKDKEAIGEQKNLYAIKKSKIVFEHKTYARSMLRQLKLLRLLNHENVLRIRTIGYPKSREEFNDIYIISQMMDTDLGAIIKSDQVLNQSHHCFFLYQIIRGLKYIHSANIIHRDLVFYSLKKKPRNLLVNSTCDLKICDFGLARHLCKTEKANVLTQYTMTRWYRAPELLLSSARYNASADMWSVGCIFAELIKRKPLFPGTSSQHQIDIICEAIQIPQPDKLPNLSQNSKKLIQNLSKKKIKNLSLSTMLPKASQKAIDLLKKLLTFNPEKRISAKEALAHPYFKDLHSIEDEPERDELNPIEFQFEDYNLTTQQLKDLLYEEALLYNDKKFFSQYHEKKNNKKSLIEHVVKNSNSKNIDPNADED